MTPLGPTIDDVMFVALVVESVLCVAIVLALIMLVKWGKL